MSNKVIVNGGVGFTGLLFIVLLVCKLFGDETLLIVDKSKLR